MDRGLLPRPGRRSIWGSGSPSPVGLGGSGWWMCVSPLEFQRLQQDRQLLPEQRVLFPGSQGAPVPVGVACPLFAGNGLVKHVVAQLYTRLPVALGLLLAGKPAPSTSSCSWLSVNGSGVRGSGVSPLSLGPPDLQDLARKEGASRFQTLTRSPQRVTP